MIRATCYHILWTRQLFLSIIIILCILSFNNNNDKIVHGACPQRSMINPCTCQDKNRGFDIICEGKRLIRFAKAI